MSTVRIDTIKIRDRVRQDLGDIRSLAALIEEVGLLHPVVVNENNELIAGRRRIAAFKSLGWSEIPVTVIPLQDIVLGEIAENIGPKDLTPSEEVAVYRMLEPVAREAAKKRQGGPGRERSGKLPERSRERTRDKLAAYIGKSGTTLENQAAVVDAAEAEPEKYGKLLADMERTGKVNGVYRQLITARKAETIRREPPPLPAGPFRVIVADPPWQYHVRPNDPSHRAVAPYPLMSIEAICALPVSELAHDDAVLWLWTTNAHMRFAFGVLDAWGFEHKTTLTWFKDKMGTGNWLRGQTEHCLMGVRGKPVVTLGGQSTALYGQARGHSEKPEEFYTLVESLCPAPPGGRVELFQRTPRPGWVGHGDEVRSSAA